MLLPQCETALCLEHIEEIAAIEGVDGIFVGPYDLSAALGIPGQLNSAELEQAIAHILTECKKNGKASIEINECAAVLQFSQQCFEGLKAYTTADGKIVTFRPELNAQRMAESCRRLLIPEIPAEMFLEAIDMVVQDNADCVPPFGSGATLYLRPFMIGISPTIGVHPADRYIFRVFGTPVGPYFKDGKTPIVLNVSDYDRAAPKGTGHIKGGLNYAMSLYAGYSAKKNGFPENMYLDAATRTKVEEAGV